MNIFTYKKINDEWVIRYEWIKTSKDSIVIYGKAKTRELALIDIIEILESKYIK